MRYIYSIVPKIEHQSSTLSCQIRTVQLSREPPQRRRTPHHPAISPNTTNLLHIYRREVLLPYPIEDTFNESDDTRHSSQSSKNSSLVAKNCRTSSGRTHRRLRNYPTESQEPRARRQDHHRRQQEGTEADPLSRVDLAAPRINSEDDSPSSITGRPRPAARPSPCPDGTSEPQPGTDRRQKQTGTKHTEIHGSVPLHHASIQGPTARRPRLPDRTQQRDLTRAPRRLRIPR